MEPGCRTFIEPWVSGPRLKWWRRTVPWNPFPFVTPLTSTRSPSLNTSPAFTSAPTAGASPSTGTSRRWRRTGTPAFLNRPRWGFATTFSRTSPKPRRTRPGSACATTQGPASTIVTGIHSPLSVKSWLIPRLRPRSAFTVMARLRPDADLDADREVQLREGLDRLRGRLGDVDEALVGPDLELLARLLVDVRGAQHRVALDPGREGDRPLDVGARQAGRLDDVLGGRVEGLVVVGLHTDLDSRLHRREGSGSGSRSPIPRTPSPWPTSTSPRRIRGHTPRSHPGGGKDGGIYRCSTPPVKGPGNLEGGRFPKPVRGDRGVPEGLERAGGPPLREGAQGGRVPEHRGEGDPPPQPLDRPLGDDLLDLPSPGLEVGEDPPGELPRRLDRESHDRLEEALPPRAERLAEGEVGRRRVRGLVRVGLVPRPSDDDRPDLHDRVAVGRPRGPRVPDRPLDRRAEDRREVGRPGFHRHLDPRHLAGRLEAQSDMPVDPFLPHLPDESPLPFGGPREGLL